MRTLTSILKKVTPITHTQFYGAEEITGVQSILSRRED
jgi:hypothetical protein